MSGISALQQLAQRREAIAEKLILDLPIPHWEAPNPEIHVLYKPVDHTLVRKNAVAVEKAKGDKATAEMNHTADLLIGSCTGIYALVDGERYSLNPDEPEGDLTTFDDDLARNLGMEGAPARAILRKLFINDGDVLAHSRQLVEWSGYSDQDLDEGLSGE